MSDYQCYRGSRNSFTMSRKRLEGTCIEERSLHGVHLQARTKVVKKAKPTDKTNCITTSNSALKTNISLLRRARIVALDCEMVGVGEKKLSALARCTIVGYNGDVIYDSYINPGQRVTDYRTRWSGIRPWHLRSAVPLEIACSNIKKILNSKIIVGHDLSNDFHVLGFSHPPHHRRDTAKYKNLRRLAGLTCQPSLRVLAHRLLGRRIQRGSHCSLEDAQAAMDIYKLIEQEWESELQETSSNFLSDTFWPSDILST